MMSEGEPLHAGDDVTLEPAKEESPSEAQAPPTAEPPGTPAVPEVGPAQPASGPAAQEADTTQAQQAAPKDPTLSAEGQAKAQTVADVLAAAGPMGGGAYPYEQAPVRGNAPKSLHGGGTEAWATPSVAPTTTVAEGRT